jgi:N-methylhydantoinase A
MERAGNVSRLRVGPESAGANPGPACYGRGGDRPTVTDANLLLGLFDSKQKLGGEIELNVEAARNAVQRFASRTGSNVGVVEDAWGIYRVITAAMADAIENFLVSKGYDPRHYSLMAFGAAGGIHAASIGDRLRSPRVTVPNFFPVFSAFGLMSTDIRHAYSLTDDTVKVVAGQYDEPGLDEKARYVSDRLRAVATRPMQLLEAENVPAERRAVQLFLDLRFSGQVLELSISVAPEMLERDMRSDELRALLEEWIGKYKRVYGAAAAWTKGVIEVINYRAIGVGRIDPPQVHDLQGKSQERRDGKVATRKIYLGEWMDAEVWDAAHVWPGLTVTGPALLQSELRTVLAGPGDVVTVDRRGHLLITPGGRWGWR